MLRMKLLLPILAITLVGCDRVVPKESSYAMLEDVTQFYQLPKTMSNCKVYHHIKNGDLNSLTIIDCLGDADVLSTQQQRQQGKNRYSENISIVTEKK